MKFDHINISAGPELLETVKDFYCDALGLQVGPRPQYGVPGYWLYAGQDQPALIHLLESEQHSPPQHSHLDHVAFQVAELAPIKQVLSDRDIPFRYIDLPDFGLEQIQFTDPAGIKIEINSHTRH